MALESRELSTAGVLDYPSRCGVAVTVKKNCEPLVFGPALAMDRRNGSVCPMTPPVHSSGKVLSSPGFERGSSHEARWGGAGRGRGRGEAKLGQ